MIHCHDSVINYHVDVITVPQCGRNVATIEAPSRLVAGPMRTGLTPRGYTMSYDNMSQAELIAELAKQRAENDKLKASAVAQATRKLSLKVSEKGAISLYGMGRFPVTLYGEQWTRLLDHSVVIRDFIETNASLLSVKGQVKAS